MKNEEAIHHLEEMRKGIFLWDMSELIDLCISALSITEGEYIKRIDAIEALSESALREDDYYYGIAYHAIMDLTTYSVPEREKGEWIKIQSGDDKFPESIVCSKCKNENSHLDFDEHGEPIGKVFITSKFCPNCGADMKGGVKNDFG